MCLLVSNIFLLQIFFFLPPPRIALKYYLLQFYCYNTHQNARMSSRLSNSLFLLFYFVFNFSLYVVKFLIFFRFFKSENIYHCPTCDKNISVIHIVWFIKHLTYCGVDNDKANQILKLGDLDTPFKKDDIKVNS